MARRRRRGSQDDELTLFDAPLNLGGRDEDPRSAEPGPAAETPPPEAEDAGDAPGVSLPLFPEEEMLPEPDPVEVPTEPEVEAAAEGATVPARLLAGLADVAIHAGVVALLLWGVHAFGIPLTLELWPPLLLFLGAFSFLYAVVPLAFWGQTPGMASLGLLTCTADDQHLTFAQTARRWLAGVLTLVLLGLPTLLAFGGRRSLADVVSGSRTVQLPEE
jgi:uncharacterized RDD family membrane protein YckC